MLISHALVALLSLVVTSCQGQDVQTSYGTVRGQTIPVHLTTGDVLVTSFFGVPYASPPVGNLRFEPPIPPPQLDGVFVASELPHACMQNPVGLLYLTHPFWTDYDEDCLTINIFTPTEDPGPHPVMVWFHGGGYVGGSAVQYPGHFLAARGVVVVAVNYRMGVFGFAATPDGVIPGNMGMYDQIMSLKYVQDNIAAFGGRPNSVTIFGQSAGASSASLLMVSPKAKGLFHRAIMESGAESNVWTLNYPGQRPEEYIYQVADNLNCTKESTAAMLACLRATPAPRLRIADDIVCTPGYFCQGFAPIVDGPGGFMPDNPLVLRQELKGDSVEIIAGICRNDGALYTLYFIPEAGQKDGFTREEFEFYLRTRLVDIFQAELTPEQYEQAYNAMDWQYSPWPYLDDEWANREAINQLLTDAAFGYAWDRQTKINSEYAPTYAYIQAFKSLNFSSTVPEWMGVPHNGELPYVWGYGYLLQNQEVRDDQGIQFDVIGWTPEDIPYADYVQTMWTNFAKYGNPTPTPIKAPFNDTMTQWPLYDWNDNLKIMYLDGEISTVETYRQQQYAFYTSYLSKTFNRPVKRSTEKSVRAGFRTSVIQDAITRTVQEVLGNSYPEAYNMNFDEFKRRG